MNLLFVASECAPFVKTGGLADVIGAVPKALAAKGISVKIMLPAYRQLADLMKTGKVVSKVKNLFGGPARLVSVQAEGLDILLLDAPHLYDRAGGIYQDEKGEDWSDNYLRFGGLSLIGAKLAVAGVGGWKPDIVNAHDWQAGLVALYLRQEMGQEMGREIDQGAKSVPPCVMTIHNIAFQGLFEAKLRRELGINEKYFTFEGAEFFGKIGFLKAGIAFSDKITTVSPTYARELMAPEFGMGLEGLLEARQNDLTGILNGIDEEVWDPRNDKLLAANYSARSMKPKLENRRQIETRFNLTPDPRAPIFCVVSRLTTQKGLDMLLEATPQLVGQGGKLAVLGSGEKWLEKGFVDLAAQYAGSVGVIIGYDEPLSHLMQGGCDAILIPSRFEPCGLTQLYGLRYGTLPVVARTGGLADTVIDANEAALAVGCATGIQFSPINTRALGQAISRTCALYADKKTWKSMIRRAMGQPVGWDKSAEAYARLYDELVATSLKKPQ